MSSGHRSTSGTATPPATAGPAATQRGPGPAPGAGPEFGSGHGPVPPVSRAADPVRELLHLHRELCERAVDPLEIAAVLEAHGITDRVAARFRHRDVFSLAEELFARAPRAEGRRFDATVRSAAPAPAAAPRAGTAATAATAATVVPGSASPRVLRPLLAVLPGVLAAAAVAVWASSGTGSGHGAGAGGAARAGVAVALGLACALGPAVWCARWFAVRVRRRLERSRSLDEFGAGMRPLLTAAVVLFAAALTGLQLAVREIAALAGVRGGGPGGVLPGEAMPAVTALGVLLFAALLLAVHGFRGAAVAGLLVACALQAAAAAAAAVASSAPASAASAASAACGCTALCLLACAYRLLSRASAHRIHDVAAKSEPPGRVGIRGRGRRCERCESPGGAGL